MKPLLVCAALVLAGHFGTMPAVSAASLQGSPDFARVDNDAGGKPRALQVAVVRYQRPGASDAISVDLIGAVHIADKAYYQTLNERFRDYDVLLYELIVSDPDSIDEGQVLDKGLLTNLQIGMKDALGLAFQLDEIDYRAANFVHADFSADMLLDSMEERGESLYVYFWRIFYTAIDDYARDPLGLQSMQTMTTLLDVSDDNAFKIAIAYEMVKATQNGDFLGDDQGSAVIAARNEHAVKILRAQLAGGARRIGIFYGAAHMVDLDKRLVQELGLQAVTAEWLDAWRFDHPAPQP